MKGSGQLCKEWGKYGVHSFEKAEINKEMQHAEDIWLDIVSISGWT